MKIVPALLFLIALCLIPLMFGMESILLVELPGGLPLGTLMAALAMVYASLIPVIQSKPRLLLTNTAWVLLAGSVLWLPLGIYLSGSAGLNFVNDGADSHFFWRYTVVLSLGILIVLAITTGKTLVEKRKGSAG